MILTMLYLFLLGVLAKGSLLGFLQLFITVMLADVIASIPSLFGFSPVSMGLKLKKDPGFWAQLTDWAALIAAGLCQGFGVGLFAVASLNPLTAFGLTIALTKIFFVPTVVAAAFVVQGIWNVGAAFVSGSVGAVSYLASALFNVIANLFTSKSQSINVALEKESTNNAAMMGVMLAGARERTSTLSPNDVAMQANSAKESVLFSWLNQDPTPPATNPPAPPAYNY